MKKIYIAFFLVLMLFFEKNFAAQLPDQAEAFEAAQSVSNAKKRMLNKAQSNKPNLNQLQEHFEASTVANEVMIALGHWILTLQYSALLETTALGKSPDKLKLDDIAKTTLCDELGKSKLMLSFVKIKNPFEKKINSFDIDDELEIIDNKISLITNYCN